MPLLGVRQRGQGSLLVDFRDGLRKGGESGPAVVPGKPAESLLLSGSRGTNSSKCRQPANCRTT
ncbi:MAG: c-type cytochrome domain-containing protein [Planctomycetaceae bacterium]